LYRATPLHTLCWTAQRSIAKVALLLRNASKFNHLDLRNQFGGTVLHSACGSQASLAVIQTIVQAHPSLVLARTSNGYQETALTALWHSHLQSIPAHIEIASILKQTPWDNGMEHKEDHGVVTASTTSDHFVRFWEKVTFLAQVAVQQSSSSSLSSSSSSSSSSQQDNDETDTTTTSIPATRLLLEPAADVSCELHGMFLLRAPINAIKAAIMTHPHWARFPDRDGNYPLHVVVLRRPFRIKDGEVVDLLLRTFPEAAGLRNTAGDCPRVGAPRSYVMERRTPLHRPCEYGCLGTCGFPNRSLSVPFGRVLGWSRGCQYVVSTIVRTTRSCGGGRCCGKE
jgi:hypothetical protein